MAGTVTCGRPLVIGLGFLGAHLAEALASSGLPVRALTRSPPSEATRQRLPAADIYVGDANDPSTLATVLREDIDHVIYTATGLLPAATMADPVGETLQTLPPLIRVLEALSERAGTSITYISSGGAIYGNPEQLPVSEEHPTRPVSPYGITKLAAEAYVDLYDRVHGVGSRILRCANVYGTNYPSGRDHGAVNAFIECARSHKPAVIYGAGETVRDYVLVDDVASAVLKLIDAPDAPRLLNVGSGVGTSLSELVAMVSELNGEALEVRHRPRRPGDVERIVLDVGRLREAVDFTPLALDAGLRQVWRATAELDLGVTP